MVWVGLGPKQTVGDGVAHAAHLGGLLFGWFWVQVGYHRGEGLWNRLSER